MKGYDLLKGMGYIDDDIAGEALDALPQAKPAAQEKKAGFGEKLKAFFFGRSAARWVAAAACLAVAVYAGWGITQGSKDSLTAPAEAPLYMNDSMKNAEESDYEYAGMEEAEEDVEMDDAAAEIPHESEPSEAPAAAAGAPVAAEDEQELDAVEGLIEDYPGDYENACYAVPAAGETGYSMPLQDAMAEYDRTVTYRVCADIFPEGAEEPLPGDDPEVAELLGMLTRDYGIATKIETYKDASGEKRVLPTLQATFDQLRRFPADEEHGWMLFLYGERAE
ncbi:MAG: hypothetical protein J6X24_02035 [Firmicutes bacterium]|nr:hypothetical protein [Bacillota bacterium]